MSEQHNGKPLYKSWKEVPAGLLSKGLLKSRGRKVKDDALPAAYVEVHGRIYAVYALEDTVQRVSNHKRTSVEYRFQMFQIRKGR